MPTNPAEQQPLFSKFFDALIIAEVGCLHSELNQCSGQPVDFQFEGKIQSRLHQAALFFFNGCTGAVLSKHFQPGLTLFLCCFEIFLQLTQVLGAGINCPYRFPHTCLFLAMSIRGNEQEWPGRRVVVQVIGKGKQTTDGQGFVCTGRTARQEAAGIVKCFNRDKFVFPGFVRTGKEGINISGQYLLPVYGGAKPTLHII